ncbi:MAG TPA: cell division ATP-binding protein FtsE [Thermoanaerobaculia bacterium]|nr:cell division ATP-binding protein FtsE [Thermoanaerobaculia bacterium]
MIRFYGVRKQYGAGRLALDDVSFEVEGGEFVFLSGSSGAGKSTLLRLIYREELPTSGQILVAGRNVATMPEKKIPFLRRSIGIVFQDFRLIARKTVFENVAYLPRILGEPPARQQELALEALGRVGLGHRLKSFPRELSGGEQQRVAVARALIRSPKLLLADEPTGNLDPELSIEILRMFAEIQARGTTVFIATHDRSLIERIGGRILTLQKGRLVGDEILVGTDEGRSRPPAKRLGAEQPLATDADDDAEEVRAESVTGAVATSGTTGSDSAAMDASTPEAPLVAPVVAPSGVGAERDVLGGPGADEPAAVAEESE